MALTLTRHGYMLKKQILVENSCFIKNTEIVALFYQMEVCLIASSHLRYYKRLKCQWIREEFAYSEMRKIMNLLSQYLKKILYHQS